MKRGAFKLLVSMSALWPAAITAVVSGVGAYAFARIQFQAQVDAEVARARNSSLIEILEPSYSDTVPKELLEGVTAAKYLKYLVLADADVVKKAAVAAPTSVACRVAWTEACVDQLVGQLQAERSSFGREQVDDATLKTALMPSLNAIWEANAGLSNAMFYLTSYNNELQVHDVPEINYSDVPADFQRNFPREKFIIVVSSVAMSQALSNGKTLCFATAGVSLQAARGHAPSYPAVNAISVLETTKNTLPGRKECALRSIRRALTGIYMNPPDQVFPRGR